jgi:hypothetical protein
MSEGLLFGDTTPGRRFQVEARRYDVVVVGGGMAGIAAAVTAASEGATVALVQDRPVLGGTASPEVRVAVEGANGGHHNRFYSESGVAEDLLLENFRRNPTGSADHWHALLLERVLAEDRLDLYLDTFVSRVSLDDNGRVESVGAHTMGSERSWQLTAEYFVDASGDATVAFLAGADFMYGEEGQSQFNESLAPVEPSPITLGGTMMFMCKDIGRPVHFEAPAFARKVTPEELKVHRTPDVWSMSPILGGFWWIEYGGELDTIRDNPEIKQTLLAEVYGIWDYVKNAPEWRERNLNLDLEWVAPVVGKRESRRVIGDHVLTENDLMRPSRFPDAVALGGWSIDNHAPKGFLDVDKPPCVMVHPPSIYQIPLRSLFSRDVANLYLAGRDISTSHVACCSARVMLTGAHCGEAVGASAALSALRGRDPREIVSDSALLSELRARLQALGHYIPFVEIEADRLPKGTTFSSSTNGSLGIDLVDETTEFDSPRMLSLPLVGPELDSVALWLQASRPFALWWRIHGHDPKGTWLPGDSLAAGTVECAALPDGGWVALEHDMKDISPGYIHLACGTESSGVRLGMSRTRPLGPLHWAWDATTDPESRAPSDEPVEYGWERTVSPWRRDDPWEGNPRPTIAFRVSPPHVPGAAAFVGDPHERPTVNGVHAWVSETRDGISTPDGRLEFDQPQWLRVALPNATSVEWIEIYFNSDVDRHLTNIWYQHPAGERAMSTLVADFTVSVDLPDGSSHEIADVCDNHRRRRRIPVGRTIVGWKITCTRSHGERYASIVDLRMRATQPSR